VGEKSENEAGEVVGTASSYSSTQIKVVKGEHVSVTYTFYLESVQWKAQR
jgi:hypothetical protein